MTTGPLTARLRNTQRGFTLGELLSAAAIMGISLSLVAPSLNSAVHSNQRARAVNELVGTVYQAHSAAITRNEQISVCPSTDGKRCDSETWESGWIQFVDEDRDGHADPGEEVLGVSAGIEPFVIHSAEFAEVMAFQPNGRVRGTDPELFGGRFHLCDPADAVQDRIVLVTSSGAPQLLVGDGADVIPECRIDDL